MATKSVKRTTITTKTSQQASGSGMSTPARGAASPGRARAPSPARITRTQEKEELSSLNDRLANYIDRVRFLETENSRLMVQVRQSEETTTREVTSIKSMYESELSDARKLLDETAKEKARLQLEATKYKEEANEWLTKYSRKERALKDAEKKVAELEAELAEALARLAEAEKKVKPLEKDNNSLRGDVARLERQLADTKKQLEEEILRRVDIENRLQSMKEEIAFKSQIHEQELNETRTRMSTTIEEVDGRIQEDYEAKLADALRDMRAQQDLQIQMAREEIVNIYEAKLIDLEGQAKRSGDSASYIREEMRTTKKRVDELLSEVTKLRAQNAEYESRIRNLENQLQREQDEHMAGIRIREEELLRLRNLLDDQSQEYADLLDIKIKLDMEIAAYNKLLEGEEARLNISSSTESTPKRTAARSVVRGVKRKRTGLVEEEISQSSSNSGYAATSSAKSGVEVNDTDVEGKFVKLYNNSDKDVALGGWQIKHVAGEQETTYKFHRSSSIKAGQYVTVWSSNSGQTHSPPSDLVMKGQKWFINDSMKTTLLNNSGDEMAIRELNKSMLSSASSYRTSYSGGRDIDGTQLSEQDRCSIM